MLFLILFVNDAFAGRYYKFRYFVEEKDSLARIIQKFTHKKASVNADDSMVRLTIRENEKIKNWKNFKKIKSFWLYILMNKGNKKQILSYIKLQRKLNRIRIRKYKKRQKELQKILDAQEWQYGKRLTLFGFYTMSVGTFDESLSTDAEISTTQSSPITLGGGLAWRLSLNGSISSSFYYSKLEANTNEATGQEIDIPNELGLTAYYQYNIPYIRSSIYGGLDYETFSTFNLDEVFNLGSDLAVQENKILWYTLGVAKFFQTDSIGNFLFKGSYSTSISENTNRSIPYTGNKFILYLNWKPGDELLYHVLYKQHDLVGSTQLTVKRYGIGIGWTFY